MEIFLSMKDVQDYIGPPPGRNNHIYKHLSCDVSVSPRKDEICVLSRSKDSLNHENPAY